MIARVEAHHPWTIGDIDLATEEAWPEDRIRSAFDPRALTYTLEWMHSSF